MRYIDNEMIKNEIITFEITEIRNPFFFCAPPSERAKSRDDAAQAQLALDPRAS